MQSSAACWRAPAIRIRTYQGDISNSILEVAAPDEGARKLAQDQVVLVIDRETGALLRTENEDRSRVELHLVSCERQRVSVCGKIVDFARGETIHTECSYKYTIESFGDLAARAGWTRVESWTDERDWFSVHVLALRDTAH